MRLVHKFGPFSFGEPSFGDWPAEPQDGTTEIDGPAWPPSDEPWRGYWRMRGRVRMRSRSTMNQVSHLRSVAVFDPRVSAVWNASASGVAETSRVRAAGLRSWRAYRVAGVTCERGAAAKSARFAGLSSMRRASLALRSRSSSDQFVNKKLLAAAVASVVIAMDR